MPDATSGFRNSGAGWCRKRSPCFTEAANSSRDSEAAGTIGSDGTCSPSSRAAVRSSQSATPTRRQSCAKVA